MATTATASLAQTGVQPNGNHTGVTLSGTSTGASGGLSASASAVLLMAKLPYGCKNVMLGFSAIHTGATGAKLQFGVVDRGGSVTASAISTQVDLAVTTRTAWQVFTPYNPDWADADSHQWKYLQCSTSSGTITAGFVIDYQVSYDFGPV